MKVCLQRSLQVLGCRSKLNRIMSEVVKNKRCITICVEGNIGSGKTTMLEYFKKNVPDVEVCEEPVKLWQNIGGGNLLGLMYKDPKRWSYTFQTYTLLTMLQLHNQPQMKEHKLMERSAFSAVYCFVENLFQSGKISQVEYSIHHEWFDWLKKVQTPKVDLLVYIRTSPEECLKRVKERARSEEDGLPLDLLQQIHDRYEEWLVDKTRFELPAPVLVVDGDKPVEEMIRFYYEKSGTMFATTSNGFIDERKAT
eukprot:Seg2651.6 transcript_id=Seg2651.6/GoldUCD/mRNA.D3Y31 product="Thymidine kinase 2 mitochondrial" protein_id=Seg2651.6/GoldUCD/D3Y31